MPLMRAAEWFILALVILIGLMLLLAGTAYADVRLRLDPCATARINIATVKNKTLNSIERAEGARRGSAVRLAVQDARAAAGYYVAMKSLLPLACKGDDLYQLDEQLTKDMDAMTKWADDHW